MAALSPTAVSLFPTSLAEAEDYTSMKAVFFRRVKLVLTGQGTLANPISAAALGFKKLVACGPLFDVTGAKVTPAVVDPANNVILLGAPGTGTPTDVTTTVAYITVWGT
jgi:2-keto-3-deoxy-6-phosphogluconate aldolase